LLRNEKGRQEVNAYYCERLSSDVILPNNVRDRARDVVEFVGRRLKPTVLPQVIWIRFVTQDVATEIIKRRRAAGDLAVGCPSPVLRLEMRIDGGFTPNDDSNEIWIQRDLDLPTLEFVVAHEVRHIWQKTTNVAIFDDSCRSECDAYAFAYDELKQYLKVRTKEGLAAEIEADIDHKRDLRRAEFLKCCPHIEFRTVD
jgi:hypothetical protein